RFLRRRGAIPRRESLEDASDAFVAHIGERKSALALLHNDALAFLLAKPAGRKFKHSPVPALSCGRASTLSRVASRFGNSGDGRNSLGNARRAACGPDTHR